MSELAFFDTNILLYADDAGSSRKRNRAITLVTQHLKQGTAVVSLQVLQEYYVVATRKLGVDPALAQRKVELLGQGRVVKLEVPDVVAAIELHRLRTISFWDALVVHAARMAGVAVLYSEDLQSGAALGSVRVVNPFAS